LHGLGPERYRAMAEDIVYALGIEEYEIPAYDFENKRLFPVFRFRLVEDALFKD
jgi:hypothetical protein